MIRDGAQKRRVRVDGAGFEKAMEEQRERSRKGMKETAAAVSGVVGRLPLREVSFLGYDATLLEGARILALIRGDRLVEELAAGEEGQVLLDRTPFYAE